MTRSRSITRTDRSTSGWTKGAAAPAVPRRHGCDSDLRQPRQGLSHYVATASGIDMAGNQPWTLAYSYNKYANGTPYGYVNLSGNCTINGSVYGNNVDINGNPTINYTKDLVTPIGGGYYGLNNSWGSKREVRRLRHSEPEWSLHARHSEPEWSLHPRHSEPERSPHPRVILSLSGAKAKIRFCRRRRL